MYKEAIKKYPIRYGEIIQIGSNRFVNTDNQDQSNFAKLMDGQKAQMIFTDPPWNKGNYKMFRTKAGYNGEVTEEMYIKLIKNLFQICKQYCEGDIYINFGNSFEEKFLNIAESFGYKTCNVWEVWYSDKNTNMIWYSGKNKYSNCDLFGALNKQLVRWAVRNSSKENDIVLDPFCGKLFFGKEFIKLNRICYGSELIPDKLALGIKEVNQLVKR